MLMLLSLAASFLYFFADPITLILFGGSAISQASLISIAELIQWFSPYIVVAGLNIYLSRLNYLCQQSGALLIATILIASVQVGLTLVLKPVIGIVSIPACAIIASFVLIIVQHKFLKRDQINVLNWSEFLWATLPGLAGTLLSWLLSKSSSISLSALILNAAACLFLTLSVLYLHKNSFIHSFINQTKKG
ncbi:hypothetical protein [Candidatus Odyssella thessalonicensis]|uniref:hypothetical protein n=1 Tax=Candidatus Odyssella thessalonicensis TaxID=84647 RepID=UPI000225C0B9|nr:hypothetical protein [Candidatus Odyssella thessalonicensis]